MSRFSRAVRRLLTSAIVKEAYTIAREVIPIAIRESLAHPEWTDADRRAYIAVLIKSVASARHPRYAVLIGIAIDFVIDKVRDAIKARGIQ